MNAWRKRNLLEGIGNSLILSTGLVFQQLENMQSIEDDLKDARRTSERLAQEKDQISIALESKKSKVVSLTQEKSSDLEEKQLALQEKESTQEEKRKSDEEKKKSAEETLKAFKERGLALKETKTIKAQNLEL